MTIGLIASISIVSCSKNNLSTVSSNPVADSLTASIQDTSVFASSWMGFNATQTNGDNKTPSCPSCTLVFQDYVPDLDPNVLTGGKVLVYVKFANVEVSVGILPTRTISLTTENYQIQISATRQNFSNALFKYILIPPNVLARTTLVDFSDYAAVVAYFQLPE